MKNIFEKYNTQKHESTFAVDLKTVDHWIKASELTKNDGLQLNVIAIGKKNSKYGDSGFIVGAVMEGETIVGTVMEGETIGLNVPKWYIETLEDMVSDTEVVESIRAGGVTVKLGKRTNPKNGKEYPSFEWDEMVLPF